MKVAMRTLQKVRS